MKPLAKTVGGDACGAEEVDTVMSVVAVEPRSIRRRSDLTSSIELHLIEAHKRGDRTASEALLRVHNGMVHTSAKKWFRSGVDPDDLLQGARMGFLHAVDLFDSSAGAKLIHYAAIWMRSYIRRYINNHGAIIRVPVHIMDKAGGHLSHVAGESDDVRAERIRAGRVEAEKWLYKVATISLETPTNGDQASTVAGTIRSNEDATDDSLYALGRDRLIRELVSGALQCLRVRDRWIIRLRHLEDPTETLLEIGNACGITKQRVQQIEERCLSEMREALDMDDWDSFDDWLEYARIPDAVPRVRRRGRPCKPKLAEVEIEQ